jgi:hypothetical protein
MDGGDGPEPPLPPPGPAAPAAGVTATVAVTAASGGLAPAAVKEGGGALPSPTPEYGMQVSSGACVQWQAQG